MSNGTEKRGAVGAIGCVTLLVSLAVFVGRIATLGQPVGAGVGAVLGFALWMAGGLLARWVLRKQNEGGRRGE